MAAETSDLLVIDCRAASNDLFIGFFDEVGLGEVLRSLDARLTVICLVNHKADSVEQLRILSDALRNGCPGLSRRTKHTVMSSKFTTAARLAGTPSMSCTDGKLRCRACTTDSSPR
ncbi:MAG: hypothetical protein ACREIF_11750 [Chthoniobacterales bacterium]